MEVVFAVEKSEHNQGVIRHHVHISAILVITVIGYDSLPCQTPVAIPLVPVAKVINQSVNDRIFGNKADCRVQQMSMLDSANACASIAATT